MLIALPLPLPGRGVSSATDSEGDSGGETGQVVYDLRLLNPGRGGMGWDGTPPPLAFHTEARSPLARTKGSVGSVAQRPK
ncbi:hypothetical protein FRC03_007522 [Tulasnella sp. 419]|nr:hypothetical protein FRC03_007522 [Tulasnella sp. 419]